MTDTIPRRNKIIIAISSTLIIFSIFALEELNYHLEDKYNIDIDRDMSISLGNEYYYKYTPISWYDSDSDLGEPVRKYRSSSPFYKVEDKFENFNISLDIYDCYKKRAQNNMSEMAFFQSIAKKYSADGWREVNIGVPIRAITSFGVDKRGDKFMTFLVSRGNKIYKFEFFDNYRPFTFKSYEYFLSIIKDIDYTKLDKFEFYLNDMILWICIFFSILILSGISIFLSAFSKIEKTNLNARKLSIYTAVCFAIIILIPTLWIISGLAKNPIDFIVHYYFEFDFKHLFIVSYISSIIIYSFLGFFLSRKSQQEYTPYYLIPNWILKKFNISNEFRKRIFMVLIIYPLFYIGLIPVLGEVIIAIYILPTLLIMTALRATYLIFKWIWDGKKIDSQKCIENNTNLLYCRFCGKIIDTNSSFCKYCGKKL